MNDKQVEAVEKAYHEVDYTFTCTFDRFNERIRVEHYDGNLRSIMSRIQTIFTKEFTKCILKVKREHVSYFLSMGYTVEGIIEAYYSGSDAYLMTLYNADWRRNSLSWLEEDQLLAAVRSKQASSLTKKPLMRKGTEADAEALAVLYQNVFDVYPTPMDNPHYIKKVMKNDTIFFLIEDKDRIVSAASAEVNRTYKNAEMTDCATLLEHRKGGTMRHLIMALEQELLREKIYYAYSIARSRSFGMNAVLQQLGYKYGGRLVNNVRIFKDWENMNLWSKPLIKSAE
ncbi:putative beta-lysine N-acetyltransferase [Pseudalkalibacillus hwajinpoensis]|uniref:putative beta-lysine N-acetyltransferase n=1 Tax=Guptibacillus hwajinpoensis TaxID=208199 RepID=UPI001CFD6949|nr:putative beta-lysine N-acetyltransferase [Pseudalkalibacillus hwajinpoensis]